MNEGPITQGDEAVEQLIDGVNFGEGPRWHDGELWYADFYQRRVYSVTTAGVRTTRLEVDDQPSGMGWMPDGSLLVVGMTKRQVLRAAPGSTELVVHADLSEMAPWHCNDMVVDAAGNAYVGNFGFDLDGGAEWISTDLILVRADGSAEVAAPELFFPNGSVITADGSTLIVGETMGARYTAFPINADATLGESRVWAEVPGTAPDGCSQDREGGIWFADAVGKQVVRVEEGGTITHQVPTPQPTFACQLGGADGATLFVLTAKTAKPDGASAAATGAIWTHPVEIPAVG